MLKIIPEPRKIEKKKGSLTLADTFKIFAGKEHANTVKRLQDILKKEHKLELKFKKVDSAANTLVIAEKFAKPTLSGLKTPESHTLDISSKIVIEGADPAGVFYGAMTLLQMLEDGIALPKVSIKDAPAMELRAEHWDLKGMMPTFAYLKQRLLDLSKYKINAILSEYEDKFEFEKHPKIVSPVALTKKQVKELVKIAEANFIDIIPLVQSLGHAEYVLKHKEYSFVAESDDNCQQYCATNPATFELFKEFLDEMLPLHSSKFVHVGGDETRQLGECPECAAVVEKEGKIGLYFRQIKKVCDYVVSIGKVPMIWDDMLCRNFRKDLLNKLPKETIMVPWLYSMKDEKQAIFYGPDHSVPYSKEWLKKSYGHDCEKEQFLHFFPNMAINWGTEINYGDIPANEKKKFAKYVEIKESPQYFNSAPAIPLIKDSGLRFVGAGAAQASSDGKFMPHSENKIANLKTWSKIVAKQKGLGLIATAWTRSGTLDHPNGPFDARWHMVMAMAEHSWAGGKTDDEFFDRKFNWRMFGLDDLRLTDALFFLRNPEDSRFAPTAIKLMNDAAQDITRNQSVFEVFLNAAELIRTDLLFTNIWKQNYKGWFYKIKGNTLHKSKRTALNNTLDGLAKAAKKGRASTKKALSKTMPGQEVEEYLECVFAPIEDFVKRMK